MVCGITWRKPRSWIAWKPGLKLAVAVSIPPLELELVLELVLALVLVRVLVLARTMMVVLGTSASHAS